MKLQWVLANQSHGMYWDLLPIRMAILESTEVVQRIVRETLQEGATRGS